MVKTSQPCALPKLWLNYQTLKLENFSATPMYICQSKNAVVWMPPHTKQTWNAILRHAVSSINKWFRFIHPNIRYTDSLILFPLNPLVNSIFRPVNEEKKTFSPSTPFLTIFLFQSFPLFIFFLLFFHLFSFILFLSFYRFPKLTLTH